MLSGKQHDSLINSFGVYHGNEEWVLKGIGVDIAAALKILCNENQKVIATDKVFKRIRLDTDCHIFVQQGQLNSNCNNEPEKVPSNTICLFTHLDINNFNPKILSKCKGVIFNSSIQLSQAIANGYNPSNAYLQPHAVDDNLHMPFESSNKNMQTILDELRNRGKVHDLRSAVGFCGRYMSKYTYKRRKNYKLVADTVNHLANQKIPVVVLGPGWEAVIDGSSPYIALIETKYKLYPYIYNLMKVFVSLSIHEGGPLPLLESMACGSYPIVTNTGFSADVITEHQLGTIISPFENRERVNKLILQQYASNDINQSLIIERAKQFTFANLAKTIVHIANKH